MYPKISVNLGNLVLSLSDALDLAFSSLAMHQQRTAFIAWELGKQAKMTASSKVVTPVKTGVQCFCNPLKSLDSGFHRNDDSWAFLTFDEFVKNDSYRNCRYGRRNTAGDFAQSDGSIFYYEA